MRTTATHADGQRVLCGLVGHLPLFALEVGAFPVNPGSRHSPSGDSVFVAIPMLIQKHRQ